MIRVFYLQPSYCSSVSSDSQVYMAPINRRYYIIVDVDKRNIDASKFLNIVRESTRRKRDI